MSETRLGIAPQRSKTSWESSISQSGHTHPFYRKDIDGLRCLAVMAVVLFHYGLLGIPGGFVGVDVFFVISGYLITGNIVADLRRDGFSYLDFYERRIRRLFPALMAVMMATFIAAWIIFLPDEFWRFARSLVSAQLYISNFIFWMEEDYFNGPSEMKPLLHTWSLSVEEQFYLLIPPILMLIHNVWPRYMARVIAALTLASFILCEMTLRTDASAAFYLLPARMWELLLGSLLALCAEKAALSSRFRDVLGLFGLFAILSSLAVLNKNVVFPGASAGLACGGTALVIVTASGGPTGVSRLLSLAPFVYVGRISYSLYLWHWPVLVFAQYLLLDSLGNLQRFVLLALSFALSILSYRYIEQPFRSRRVLSRNQLFSASAAGSLFMIVIGVSVWRGEGVPARFQLFADAANIQTEANDRRAGTCMLGPQQKARSAWSPETCMLIAGSGSPVLIWGDSHASHLRHGIEAFADQIDRPVLLFSSSACPPIMHIDVSERPSCRENNEFGLEIIARNGVKTVILAANWDFAVNHNKVPLADLLQTLAQLRALGVDVWVVGQLPIYALQNPQYLYYRLKTAGYTRPYALPPRNGPKIQDLLKAIVPDERLLNVYDAFCSGGRCTIFQNGELMVVDSAHLSPAGSSFVVRGMIAKGVFR